MKNLSRWASRHVRLAILLLIIGEVVNAFNSLLLGANGLADWSGNVLTVLLLLLLIGSALLRWWAASRRQQQTYALRRWVLVGAFGSNFLLFVMLGGIWGNTVQTSSTNRAAFGSRRVVMRSDTIVKPEPVTAVRPVAVTSLKNKAQVPVDDRQGGKRFGFIMLFVLGFLLTYFSVGLACSIACSGYGFLAVVTLALGLGFLAGGIFFLGRAVEDPIKPMRELTRAERRRTVRRFWLSWLLLIGITAGLLLIGSTR